jgi:hypothetical protein
MASALLGGTKAMKRTFLIPLVLLLSREAPAQVRVTVEPQEIDSAGPASRLNEIVAVGRGRGLLTLATPADGSREWRYRTILLHPADAEIVQAHLSRSGTKVLLEFQGRRKVVDLSRPTYSISRADPEPPPSHRLLRQVFPAIRETGLEVLDDLGQAHADYEPVDGILAAAAHDDGTILYATRAGSLFLYDPARRRSVELGFRLTPGLPAGAVHIVGGSEREPFRYLLVLKDGDKARVMDPLGGSMVAELDTMALALIKAHLILLKDTETTDDVLRALVGKLLPVAPRLGVPQARGALPAMDWSFFHVVPEVSLYAPVLETAGQERVFPSSVAIWNDLREQLDVSPTAVSGKEEVDAYLRAYLRLGDARKRECRLYERVSSYSGSWLIEYWIYYPFDVGGLEPHAHDSEHLFVEVDKLGGTVAALFGGAHGMLAPNNTYLILDDKGYPLELPLFAMVELGKHATAPDVNRDGVFTPGLDENYFKESAKVWGIRDAFGTKDTHFLLYDGSMMAPRQKENWLGVLGAESLFPAIDISLGQSVCRIESFRGEIENGRFSHPRSQEAAAILANHEDARDTRTIFKPWVFPRSFLRVGAGNDREARFPALSVAYVTDLDRIPHAGILPGRFAFEASYAPWGETPKLDFGVRYERLVSNLFGFYAGFHKGSEIVDEDFRWQDGLWFSVGPMAEIPLWKTNFLFQAGAAFRQGTSPIFEFRLAFGLYQPSRWFWGIKKDQTTPY